MKAGGRVREMALRGFVAAVLVLAGLAVLDGFDGPRIASFQLSRNDTPRPVWNAFVYAATYLAGAFGILVALCHRPVVRWVSAAVVLWLAAVQLGFAAVNGSGFSHHEAALLFTESAFVPDALRFFADRFALPVLCGVAIGSAVVWALGRFGPKLRSWAWLVVPIAAFAASQSMVDRTFGKVYQFPVPIRVCRCSSRGRASTAFRTTASASRSISRPHSPRWPTTSCSWSTRA